MVHERWDVDHEFALEGGTMGGVIGWIISLISGIIGGNIAGSAMKEQSLGTLGNSIAGLVGGGLGGQLLSALGVLGGGGQQWAPKRAASILVVSLVISLAPALAALFLWRSLA
jgi:uncharacterized membrane protein YeaQ/YmgE (transglycosylase-associated protein family)